MLSSLNLITKILFLRLSKLKSLVEIFMKIVIK